MQEFTFTIDSKTVTAKPGMTIMQAADEAGIYIPRLCSHPELRAHGSCRVCTVLVDGRPQAACTQPAAHGIAVENETEQLRRVRRNIVDMLFVEGNHYCMFCEKSGNCELQAMAYRLGIDVSQYPYLYPSRKLDASHPDVFIDHDRCILCARCVFASRDIDKKGVFGFEGRSRFKRLAVSDRDGAAGTCLAASDKAMDVCPVGTLMRKHIGYAIPMGKRIYDNAPIGTDVEMRSKPILERAQGDEAHHGET